MKLISSNRGSSDTDTFFLFIFIFIAMFMINGCDLNFNYYNENNKVEISDCREKIYMKKGLKDTLKKFLNSFVCKGSVSGQKICYHVETTPFTNKCKRVYIHTENIRKVSKKDRYKNKIDTKPDNSNAIKFMNTEFIKNAQNKADKDKQAQWVVMPGSKDPASGKTVIRRAGVLSEDGLCYLLMDARLNGNKVLSVNCDAEKRDLNVFSSGPYLEVKFDTEKTSKKVKISHFNGDFYPTDEIYIEHNQGHSADYSYSSFLKQMGKSNILAIKLKYNKYLFWVRFSLKGFVKAITVIGGEQ